MSCGNQITKENSSREHIINNSVGGNLVSSELLCKKCNSEFGDTIDAELSGQLAEISALLGVNRDRGAAEPRIKMISSSGEIKEVGLKLKPYYKLRYKVKGKEVVLFETESKFAKLLKRKKEELLRKQ